MLLFKQCWEVNSQVLTFLEVGFGRNLVQGLRAYAWRAVPSLLQIALWVPSFALWPQPFPNPNFVLIWCGAQIFRGLPWIQFEIFNQHPPTENPVSRQPSKLIFMLSERLNNYFQKKEKHLVIYFSWIWSCIETFENFFVLFEIFYFRYLAFQSQPSSNNIWTQMYHLIIDLWRHPRDRQSPIFFLAA